MQQRLMCSANHTVWLQIQSCPLTLHKRIALPELNFDLRMLRAVIFTLSDLHSVEVQLSSGGSTAGNARSCTAAHADTVGRPTNLDDQHTHLWRVLLQMPVINLPNATTAPQFPSLLVRLLGSSTCTGICCLSWLRYRLESQYKSINQSINLHFLSLGLIRDKALAGQHKLLSHAHNCSINTTLYG